MLLRVIAAMEGVREGVCVCVCVCMCVCVCVCVCVSNTHTQNMFFQVFKIMTINYVRFILQEMGQIFRRLISKLFH